MRLRRWAFWVGLGLFAAPACVLAAPTGGSPQGIEALRARCPTTRNLAPEAFERSADSSAANLEEWQQRIRGHLTAEGPPPDAEVVLRAFAGGSMTQSERSETATIVWRLPDGRWHFVEANHYPQRMVSPPPPPATLTQDQVEAARRSMVGGPLDRGQARALDALLADPCLEAEAPVVAGALPLRAGLPPMGPCFDAVPQTVEVVRSGRRQVYVQTCRHFLAGELIGLALYPRREGQATAVPVSQTLATPESARRFADQLLGAAHGGESWLNATAGAGGYALVHRSSGFRCVGTQPYEVEVYGRDPREPEADGARCLRNTSMPVASGIIKTEWEVVSRKAKSDVRRRVYEGADQWFSSYHGSAAHRRIRMGTMRVDGIRMARAEVAGERKVDARDDELTILIGAEHDGWVLVSRATGSATNPAAVEAAAVREWRQAVATRADPPRPS